MESIRAIGVDEIQYAKDHKYLMLVYQIDAGFTRLRWAGKERTIASFEGFFTVIGKQLAAQIEFVCSDMWQNYLDVIRAGEARKPVQEGNAPLLKKTRWCVLKRKEHLTAQQQHACAICSATTCKPSAFTCSKRTSNNSGDTIPHIGPACFWTSGALKPCAQESSP